MKTTRIPITELVSDERCQTRAATVEAIVEEYRDAYAARAEMPPLLAFRVDGALAIVDGHHRYLAASLAGCRWLEVEVVGEGSWDEAQWYALGVNKHHGLRRTNEDKRRTVQVALTNPIGAEQSSRVLAEQCGVSHDFVARLRKAKSTSTGTLSSDDGHSAGFRTAGTKPLANPLDAPEPDPWADGPEPDDEPEPDDAEVLPPWTSDLDWAVTAILQVRRQTVTALKRHGEPTHALLHRVRMHLSDAATALSQATPTACPQCDGEGCERCGDRGWIEAGRRTKGEVTDG